MSWSSSASAESDSKAFSCSPGSSSVRLAARAARRPGPPWAGAARRARGRAAARARWPARAASGPSAGRPTPSPPPAGTGRSGPRPGRRTAASMRSWRRPRPRAAGRRRPRLTMRTATSHRSFVAENAAMRPEALGSSESTTTGSSPAICGERLRVGLGRGVVGGDDQPAGVGHPAGAQLRQAGVGGLQDRGHPVALGVEGGLPRPGGLLGGEGLAEPGRHLLARAGAPARLARVGEEDDRPHDAVGQRVGVAVGVVGLRAQRAGGVGLVGDERDRAVVGAERRPGEREPAGRAAERLPRGLAPALGVPGVVDLVEDHQRATALGAVHVQHRVRGDLRVGHGDALEVGRHLADGVRVLRVDRDAHAGGRLRPLVLEVLGGADDRDGVDRAVTEELGGRPSGRRWSCPRRVSRRPGSPSAGRRGSG